MQYDKTVYKLWDWKSFVVLHWILNPGLVFNELVLGQTIPKVMLIELAGKLPFFKRSFVPCPHCGTLHSGLKWSAQNKTAVWNWFGYYCDNCGGIIPVQRNLTTLLLLGITYPIWVWFKDSLRQRWLENQPERFRNISLEVPKKKNTTWAWIKAGLFFGLFMFVFMGILFPLIEKEPITAKRLLVSFPIWIVAGLGWGYIMKVWMNKRGKD
jgi:hypothetical protein